MKHLNKIIYYSLLFILILFFFSNSLKGEGLSVFIDLKPLFLSIDAGGFGFGIGYEYTMGSILSLLGKTVFMSLPDASTDLIYYLQGLRVFFEKNSFDKFFFGTGLIILYGVMVDQADLAFGIQLEFGYKWVIEGFEKFYIEPEIYYIYMFGELPLPGISFGLLIGLRL